MQKVVMQLSYKFVNTMLQKLRTRRTRLVYTDTSECNARLAFSFLFSLNLKTEK